MNVAIIFFNGKINQRAAVNKRKVENKKGDPEIVVPDTTEATEHISRMLNLNVEGMNGSDESGTQSIKQEKTVAASTKHKQPPSLNNEDSNCDHNLI